MEGHECEYFYKAKLYVTMIMKKKFKLFSFLSLPFPGSYLRENRKIGRERMKRKGFFFCADYGGSQLSLEASWKAQPVGGTDKFYL